MSPEFPNVPGISRFTLRKRKLKMLFWSDPMDQTEDHHGTEYTEHDGC